LLRLEKPPTPEAFEAKLKTEPRWRTWTKFMADKVVPAIGKLLAVPVFDPKKPVERAFSCGAWEPARLRGNPHTCAGTRTRDGMPDQRTCGALRGTKIATRQHRARRR
jgi:hypothetical protein